MISRSRRAHAVACARFVLGGFAGTMAWSPILAQDTVARRLPAVQVTRDKARSPMDLPYAITSVRPDSLSPGQPHTFVEQTLGLLPGLTVANRVNPSQDTRVSIRGFGARSPFGVRSLRVLRDGMPLTLPDGQTPIDYLDLESVARVETIRGSASSLYGNASGGVIDLRSPPPPSDKIAGQIRTWFGDNGMRRDALLLGGTTARATYQGNLGRTTSDGARAYSRQELTNGFLRVGSEIAGTQLSLTAMGLDMPVAENPGALTKVQYDTNETIADPQSVSKKARKTVKQMQIGLGATRPFRGDGELNAQVFGSTRTLGNPLAFSIVGIDRKSAGGSLRATLPVAVGGMTHRMTAGVDAQRLSDARKNWANCNAVGAPTATCPTLPAERGNLTLDQREIVVSVGAYVRDEIERGRMRYTAGIRADNTTFSLADNFLTDGRDDTGERAMAAISPMVGVAMRINDRQSVYANVSTAFETPTTTEMVNKPDSSAGLNPVLDPQTSMTFEVGVRGEAFGRVQYDVAAYSTMVRDELTSFDIGSGRTAFRNAGETERRGAEASLATSFGPFALNTTYTYSSFKFVDFRVNTSQFAGFRIPGVPEHQGQVAVSWRAKYGFALAEWVAKGEVFANDTNSVKARGFAVVNLRGGLTASRGQRWLTPVFGVQNVLNRKFVSSVAINAAPAAGKFFEPGAGRMWYVGLTAATAPW